MPLPIYQGDVNNAYLNADFLIKQYLDRLGGYPCEQEGHVYVVNKALYGQQQSGRKWTVVLKIEGGFCGDRVEFLTRSAGSGGAILYVDRFPIGGA